MAKLNELVGSVKPDDLIVDANPDSDVVTATLAANVGAVKRGAVIVGTPGGKDFVLLTGTAAATETGDSQTDSTATATESELEKAFYIVADDADTKAEKASGEATTVLVYRAGHFAREKVNEATGYTLTAADEEHLRKSGIFLSTLLDY